MSWATHAIEALQRGETVMVRPRGHSMRGKVDDGDLVTLKPAAPSERVVGAIVLVRVRGTDYLHLIKAVDGERYQIGNNRGGVNGWVRAPAIYGVTVKVEPYSPERKRQGVASENRGETPPADNPTA